MRVISHGWRALAIECGPRGQVFGPQSPDVVPEQCQIGDVEGNLAGRTEETQMEILGIMALMYFIPMIIALARGCDSTARSSRSVCSWGGCRSSRSSASSGPSAPATSASRSPAPRSWPTQSSRRSEREVALSKGPPRIEDRARTIEARKPWLKLDMSRRTWYRRQAEKRKGRELIGVLMVARRNISPATPLNRPPVVWDFLIVQMPDPRYVGRVPLTLRPGDGLCLGLECLEDAIPLFLDDIVHDSGPFPPAFGAGLNEDCRHVSLPDCCRSRRALHKAKGSNSCERPPGGLSVPPGPALTRGMRRLAVRGDDEGLLQGGGGTKHDTRTDDRIALELGGQAFKKARRCIGWIGAAAA